MLTIERIKEVVTKLSKKYGVKRAYLFGSYAKGEATENSDVDLIIDKGEIHSFSDFFDFHEELQNELGTEVDLLTDKGIPEHFYNRIKDDRVLLYGA